MALMALGGVLVGALVVWALTRTVQPASDPAVTTSVSNAPVSTTTPISTTSPATTTLLPPGAITTAATATAPPRPQVHGDRSTVQRIAVEDLRAKMGRNEVTVVDVRDATSYSKKHITGAINVPFASVEAMLDQIPKDKPIITYCT